MCGYWIESKYDFVVVVVAVVGVSERQIVVVDAVAVGVLRCVAVVAAAAAAEHPYFQQVTLHSSSNHFQNSVD